MIYASRWTSWWTRRRDGPPSSRRSRASTRRRSTPWCRRMANTGLQGALSGWRCGVRAVSEGQGEGGTLARSPSRWREARVPKVKDSFERFGGRISKFGSGGARWQRRSPTSSICLGFTPRGSGDETIAVQRELPGRTSWHRGAPRGVEVKVGRTARSSCAAGTSCAGLGMPKRTAR